MWDGISIWRDSKGQRLLPVQKTFTAYVLREYLSGSSSGQRIWVWCSTSNRYTLKQALTHSPLPFQPSLPRFLATHVTNYQYYTGSNFFKIRWVILDIELLKMHNDRCIGVIMPSFYAFRSNALASEAAYSYYSCSDVQSNTIPSGFMKDMKPSYSPITNVIHAGLFSLL